MKYSGKVGVPDFGERQQTRCLSYIKTTFHLISHLLRAFIPPNSPGQVIESDDYLVVGYFSRQSQRPLKAFSP